MENSTTNGYFNEGYALCQQFLGDRNMVNNPYPTGSDACKGWEAGWAAAEKRLPVLV